MRSVKDVAPGPNASSRCPRPGICDRLIYTSAIVKRILLPLLRLLLPVAVLLAQHGVWAHGFGHDLAKMASHGQTQDHTSHACCLPFESSGDTVCSTPRLGTSASPEAAVDTRPAFGLPTTVRPPYSSRAPPVSS